MPGRIRKKIAVFLARGREIWCAGERGKFSDQGLGTETAIPPDRGHGPARVLRPPALTLAVLGFRPPRDVFTGR